MDQPPQPTGNCVDENKEGQMIKRSLAIVRNEIRHFKAQSRDLLERAERANRRLATMEVKEQELMRQAKELGLKV